MMFHGLVNPLFTMAFFSLSKIPPFGTVIASTTPYSSFSTS